MVPAGTALLSCCVSVGSIKGAKQIFTSSPRGTVLLLFGYPDSNSLKVIVLLLSISYTHAHTRTRHTHACSNTPTGLKRLIVNPLKCAYKAATKPLNCSPLSRKGKRKKKKAEKTWGENWLAYIRLDFFFLNLEIIPLQEFFHRFHNSDGLIWRQISTLWKKETEKQDEDEPISWNVMKCGFPQKPL